MVSRESAYQNFSTFIKGFDNEAFMKCHEILFAIR